MSELKKMDKDERLRELVKRWRKYAGDFNTTCGDSEVEAAYYGCADELERVLAAPDRDAVRAELEAIVSKLREQSLEMESPYFTKEPEEPSWDYVAKAFKEIADELVAIRALGVQED
jgi:hypothetical protein